MAEIFAKSSLTENEKQELMGADTYPQCLATVSVLMVDTTPASSTLVRCDKPVDHAGRHRGSARVMIVVWDQ